MDLKRKRTENGTNITHNIDAELKQQEQVLPQSQSQPLESEYLGHETFSRASLPNNIQSAMSSSTSNPILDQQNERISSKNFEGSTEAEDEDETDYDAKQRNRSCILDKSTEYNINEIEEGRHIKFVNMRAQNIGQTASALEGNRFHETNNTKIISGETNKKSTFEKQQIRSFVKKSSSPSGDSIPYKREISSDTAIGKAATSSAGATTFITRNFTSEALILGSAACETQTNTSCTLNNSHITHTVKETLSEKEEYSTKQESCPSILNGQDTRIRSIEPKIAYHETQDPQKRWRCECTDVQFNLFILKSYFSHVYMCQLS